MLFKLHYFFVDAGEGALSLLIGVFMETYTGAGPFENGLVFMLLPFSSLIACPLICSLADRAQAHRKYLIVCQAVTIASYVPFIVVPLLGPCLYAEHRRACWYALVACRVVGDMAYRGMVSVGHSLAINYAHRIDVDFGVFRIWGTISWMLSGVLIGCFNEVSFLPKYVPGFIILILASACDIMCVFLWPPEYFKIVLVERSAAQLEAPKKPPPSLYDKLTRALMPKQVVWTHAKSQLVWLFTLGRLTSARLHELEHQSMGADCKQAKAKPPEPISKRAQLRALWLVLRRDPRIFLYSLMFVFAGMGLVPLAFFFINLLEICHSGDACNFSQLAGAIQISMSLTEIVVFIYIRPIQAALGRLNTCTLSFFILALKYLFYGLVYRQVSPYFALLVELGDGVAFATFITMAVELAHTFANEVEFVLPELVQSGVVRNAAEAENMRLSLAVTMQALMAVAQDGLGRGLGALLYGFILERVAYETLWTLIGASALLVCLAMISCSLVAHAFGIVLGLEEKAHRQRTNLHSVS